MPKVSVIVPNFNHAEFLQQRLKTIIDQTFSDFEVIFLDDASTDHSLRIFECFQDDPRIRFTINEENSGSPFKQWNKGLDSAQGDYIWIAETDDFSDPTFLEELVAVLDRNPNVGLAYSQSNMVQTDGTLEAYSLVDSWYMSFDDHARWECDYTNSGTSELKNYMVNKNTIPNASAVVFRRSALEQRIRAPENMRLAGDWLFWAMILCNHDIAFIAKPLNFFRLPHLQSQRKKTASQGLLLIEGLSVYEFIRNRCTLDISEQAKALKEQIKLWGLMAFDFRWSWATNKFVYQRVMETHPAEITGKWRSIIIPFVYYFVAAPLRRVPPVYYLVRGVKKAWRLGTTPRRNV